MKQVYWACLDLKGTYLPTLHPYKSQARRDCREQAHLTDGKFVAVKVRIVKVKANP